MVSRLDWRSSDAVHGQRQEKVEEDAGDEGANKGPHVAASEAAGDARAGDGGPARSQEVGR